MLGGAMPAVGMGGVPGLGGTQGTGGVPGVGGTSGKYFNQEVHLEIPQIFY